MDPLAVVAQLARIAPRAAASDGERRAAVWARDALRASGRDARLETVWVRPQRELAAALGVALALAGSVVSVWQPEIGVALLGAALASLAGELSGRALLLRRLFPERATQNVISTPPAAGDSPPERVRLIVTANVDAGHCGSIYADRWTGLWARLRQLLSGRVASPLAVVTAGVAALVALAAVRTGGTGAAALSAVQFVLTLPLVVALAALVDAALADVSPGANANASGVAVALALVAALDEVALRRLSVELVIAGAGESGALGMRAFVARRRRSWRRSDVAVLSVEPCGAGTPGWLDRDGALTGLRFHQQLRATMATVAAEERHLHARPWPGHDTSGAYPARLAGWPAIAVGCFDELGRAPRDRQPEDTPAAIDPAALAGTLELCLAFVGRLDVELAHRSEAAAVPPSA